MHSIRAGESIRASSPLIFNLLRIDNGLQLKLWLAWLRRQSLALESTNILLPIAYYDSVHCLETIVEFYDLPKIESRVVENYSRPLIWRDLATLANGFGGKKVLRFFTGNRPSRKFLDRRVFCLKLRANLTAAKSSWLQMEFAFKLAPVQIARCNQKV